ncbi:MAG TPA: ATP-binding cassette domain-containing protein [Solirubrobacteraceae bacterium]
MDGPSIVLSLRDVVKTFPGVVALKGVSFEVRAGEVHALVGENGAGKSTLMAVAAGSTVPDSGTVEIGGQPLETASPSVAQALGLGIVYQHLSILEDLTVTENMVFAMPAAQRPPMSRAGAWTRERLAAVGAAIDPAERVSDLSTANRQLVEIAKALALDAKVLILDEPTESLTRVESERLFERIRAIRDEGTAVVYISHRLPEVKRVADRITVLRDGETRGTFDATDISEGDILRLIIGRAVEQVFPDKRGQAAQAQPLLSVRALNGTGFHDISVDVEPGEVVGLAGVEGNGQRSFLRALAGMASAHGAVEVAGRTLRLGRPTRMRSAGMIHLPGDRHREGVMLSLGVRENVMLLALRDAAKAGFVRRALERPLVSRQVARLGVKTPTQETAVSSLSGGNQQKVLFARALLGEPRVLLADEPTRGVDAGARIDLYQVMREAASGGRAVVVLSSDAVELQGLCDRVLVFSRGRIVRELEGEAINEENITGAAVTSDGERHHGDLAPSQLRARRLRRFVSGDYLPTVVLALLIVVMAIATQIDNGRFLTPYNLQATLLLASALAFVSMGQLVMMLTANFDLSVGPLMGLVTVVVSFFWSTGQGGGELILGILAVIGTALAVGLVNGGLVRGGRLSSVLASLAAYIVIQGVALQLRPQEAGQLRPSITAGINTDVGWMPVAAIAAVVIAVVAEIILRRTRAGLQLRAVGSDETRAHRLGARIDVTVIAAFVICSLFAVAAGIMLAGQVGIGDGDPTLSANYTLTSIAACALGGASIYGGRGSFIGALLGSLLLTEVVAAVPFLQIPLSWNEWTPGIMILVAAGIFSRVRGGRGALLGTGDTG